MMPLLAGIVFSCVREPEAPLSDGQIPQETYAPDDEGVLKGWVRIKLRDDAQALRVGTFTRGAMESGDPELDRIAASLGATEVRRVFHEGGRFAERRRKFGLHLWYDVKFDDTLPVSRAQAELGSLVRCRACAAGLYHPDVRCGEYAARRGRVCPGTAESGACGGRAFRRPGTSEAVAL